MARSDRRRRSRRTASAAAASYAVLRAASMAAPAYACPERPPRATAARDFPGRISCGCEPTGVADVDGRDPLPACAARTRRSGTTVDRAARP